MFWLIRTDSFKIPRFEDRQFQIFSDIYLPLVPTSAEIAQAEADEEKASLEIEESITADKILEDLNRDLVVADELSEAKLAEYLSEEDPDYQPTQVEKELADEHNQLQNSSCDDEPATDLQR